MVNSAVRILGLPQTKFVIWVVLAIIYSATVGRAIGGDTPQGVLDDAVVWSLSFLIIRGAKGLGGK